MRPVGTEFLTADFTDSADEMIGFSRNIRGIREIRGSNFHESTLIRVVPAVRVRIQQSSASTSS